jgi:hypothetical protein
MFKPTHARVEVPTCLISIDCVKIILCVTSYTHGHSRGLTVDLQPHICASLNIIRKRMLGYHHRMRETLVTCSVCIVRHTSLRPGLYSFKPTHARLEVPTCLISIDFVKTIAQRPCSSASRFVRPGSIVPVRPDPVHPRPGSSDPVRPRPGSS